MNRVDLQAPRPRPNAHAGVTSSLLQRVDRAIMATLYSPSLNYQGGWSDVGRLPLRVLRNLSLMTYSPVRIAVAVLGAPVESVKRIPEACRTLLRSLASAQAIVSLLASHSAIAIAIATSFGAAVPCLVTACLSLIGVIVGVRSLLKTDGPGALFVAIESVLTGWLVGQGLACWMRLRFAHRMDALRKDMSQMYQLPEASGAFVNRNGEAIFVYDGAAAQTFLQQNPHLSAHASERFWRGISHAGWQNRASYDPTSVIIGGPQHATVSGSFSTSGQTVTWAVAHHLEPGAQVAMPSTHLQYGALHCIGGTLASLPSAATHGPRD